MIMLIMHRKAIAHSLINRLQNNAEFQLICELGYEEVNACITSYDAYAALIEVAESGNHEITYCLSLCKSLRKFKPACKLLLMCSEEEEETVKQVIAAKLSGVIDDFVFYDVTIDYLVSKLMAI